MARALLLELDERFPDSRLAEERSAARRIADCRSSEPGASDRARVFLPDHRASVYRQRIVLACALDNEPRDKSAETENIFALNQADIATLRGCRELPGNLFIRIPETSRPASRSRRSPTSRSCTGSSRSWVR